MRAIILLVLVSSSWAQQPRTPVDVAIRAAEEGDTAGAVRILETVVTADDRDARAWALLGNLLNARERYADGAQALRRALELNPADARAQFDLGVSCFHLGRIDEARAQFDKTLSAAPKDPDALWMRGQVAMREKDLDRAIACFRAAAEAPETRYKAAGRLHEGMALAWKGENDQALAALRAAAEAEPEGTAGLLASLLAGRLGDETPETLLNPEDYVAREGGCAVHAVDSTSLGIDEAVGLGRYRMGADLGLTAEQHAAPLMPRVVVRLADLAVLQTRLTGRETRFLVRAGVKQGLHAEMFLLPPPGSLLPYDASDHASRANALAWLGRQQAALVEAAQGEGIGVLESRLLLMTGRLDGSVETLSAHLSAHADSAEGWELLGLCHAWSGRWTEAEGALSKVSPKTPLTRFYLGYAAWCQGDRDRARNEWGAPRGRSRSGSTPRNRSA